MVMAYSRAHIKYRHTIRHRGVSLVLQPAVKHLVQQAEFLKAASLWEYYFAPSYGNNKGSRTHSQSYLHLV